MNNKPQHTIRRLWRVYMILCTAVCTLIGLYALYALMHYQYCYVQLPNGMRLVPTSWGQKNIALVAPNGETVVEPDIDMVIWNDHYIAGWRNATKKSNSEKRYRAFIYKIGDDAGVDGQGESDKKYMLMYRESGLKSDGKPAPENELSTMTGYSLLVQNPLYRRGWINR